MSLSKKFIYTIRRTGELFFFDWQIIRRRFLRKVIPDNDMQQGQLIDQLEKAYPTLLTIEGASLARHHSRFFYIVPLQMMKLTVYGAAIYEIKEASLAKMLDLTNSDGASYELFDQLMSFQILASTNHNDLTVFFE